LSVRQLLLNANFHYANSVVYYCNGLSWEGINVLNEHSERDALESKLRVFQLIEKRYTLGLSGDVRIGQFKYQLYGL